LLWLLTLDKPEILPVSAQYLLPFPVLLAE